MAQSQPYTTRNPARHIEPMATPDIIIYHFVVDSYSDEDGWKVVLTTLSRRDALLEYSKRTVKNERVRLYEIASTSRLLEQNHPLV